MFSKNLDFLGLVSREFAGQLVGQLGGHHVGDVGVAVEHVVELWAVFKVWVHVKTHQSRHRPLEKKKN